jgi:hypothetical protein
MKKGNFKKFIFKETSTPLYFTPCLGLELAQGKHFKQMNVFLECLLHIESALS